MNMLQRTQLERFDLLLPRAAVDIIKGEAAIRGMPPRTMGRVLIVEKVKEIIGLAPDDILEDVNPAQVCHTDTPLEGAEHGKVCV